MTIGNVDRSVYSQLYHEADNRFVVGARYSKKFWIGNDLPKRQRVKYLKQFHLVNFMSTKSYFNKKSGRYYTSTKTTKVLRYFKIPSALIKPRTEVLPPNAYSLTIRKDFDPPVFVTNNSDPLLPIQLPTTLAEMGAASWTLSVNAEDEYKLLQKLRERIVGSDFNAGVFLAEATPALGMIFNAATRIDRALRRTLKFDFKGASRALIDGPIPRSARFSSKKSASSNWLELQYGWLPLLNDVEAAAKFLAHMSSVPLKQRIVVRTRKNGDSNVAGAPGVYTYAQSTEFLTVQYVCYMKEVNLLGLSGLTDLASVVWERLPYSFVYDWFMPVGNYLQSRALAQNVSGTFVKTVVQSVKATGIQYLPSYLSSLTPYQRARVGEISAISGNTIDRYVLQRTIHNLLDPPLPNFSGLGTSSSWKRTANAVALLTQRLK